MISYSAFTQVHLQGHLGLPTALNIRPETFEYLHTPPPTPNSPQPYTPAYNDGSEAPWPNGRHLTHSGSNTMHYAETVIAPGLRETRMGFTNTGNSLEGGTAPAGNATLD